MDASYPQAKRAVVAGHICLDVIPGLDHLPAGHFDELFQPGRLVAVGAAQFATGGPVSNTGLALHILGVPVRLIAKLGQDSFGETIETIVASYDPELAAGLMRLPGETTSYSVIISPLGVDRIFIHCPGANDTFEADDVDLDALAEVDLFHFGYPPLMKRMIVDGGRDLAVLFRRLKAAGLTTSLDMAFPDPSSEAGQADWRLILGAVLPDTDIFAPSIEELLFMLHRERYEALERMGLLESLTPNLLSELGGELLEMGAKVVLLKLGHRGAYLRTAGVEILSEMGRAVPPVPESWAGEELWAPCFQVEEVAGTTGSGDATIAGLLAALLRGLDPRSALTMAVAVGACNVQAEDALGGLCSWEETRRRISAGWPRHDLQPEDPAWVWDGNHHLWVKF